MACKFWLKNMFGQNQKRWVGEWLGWGPNQFFQCQHFGNIWLGNPSLRLLKLRIQTSQELRMLSLVTLYWGPGILGCLDISLNVLRHVDISQRSKRRQTYISIWSGIENSEAEKKEEENQNWKSDISKMSKRTLESKKCCPNQPSGRKLGGLIENQPQNYKITIFSKTHNKTGVCNSTWQMCAVGLIWWHF